VPALINRIDRNTSGIVIAAKNAESLKILNEKMTLHEIKKFYLTKVHGIVSPKHAILKDYLQKDEQTNTVKIFKNKINNFSQEIITEYQVLSIDKEKDYSILEVQLHTGRTHQIRAHLSFYGYPLFGEKKYISSNKKYHDDKKYQSLISYKVLFKFTNDAGILNYLNNKIFSISSDIQNLLSLL
jgi:23S rRNA pseudouridine955/2504/2580 synthase